MSENRHWYIQYTLNHTDCCRNALNYEVKCDMEDVTYRCLHLENKCVWVSYQVWSCIWLTVSAGIRLWSCIWLAVSAGIRPWSCVWLAVSAVIRLVVSYSLQRYLKYYCNTVQVMPPLAGFDTKFYQILLVKWWALNSPGKSVSSQFVTVVLDKWKGVEKEGSQ